MPAHTAMVKRMDERFLVFGAFMILKNLLFRLGGCLSAMTAAVEAGMGDSAALHSAMTIVMHFSSAIVIEAAPENDHVWSWHIYVGAIPAIHITHTPEHSRHQRGDQPDSDASQGIP